MRARHALLLILILLTACSSGSPTPGQATSAPEPSATPRPTAGPTFTPAAPLVILAIPADMNQTQSKAYQKAVYDLAQAQGYRFVVLNKLTKADLEPALKIVIDLSPDTDVAALAASAPPNPIFSHQPAGCAGLPETSASWAATRPASTRWPSWLATLPLPSPRTITPACWCAGALRMPKPSTRLSGPGRCFFAGCATPMPGRLKNIRWYRISPRMPSPANMGPMPKSCSTNRSIPCSSNRAWISPSCSNICKPRGS